MAMKAFILLGMMAAALAAPTAAHAKRQNLILNFGQDVLIAGKDDVAIRAQCVQNEGGFDVVRVYAVSANDAVADASFGNYTGDGDYLTSMSTPLQGMLTFHQKTSGVEGFYAQSDGGHVLNLTTMHGYVLTVESTMLGLNSNGNDCLLSVDVQEVKKFKETF